VYISKSGNAMFIRRSEGGQRGVDGYELKDVQYIFNLGGWV
jgi:hypothetical protein